MGTRSKSIAPAVGELAASAVRVVRSSAPTDPRILALGSSGVPSEQLSSELPDSTFTLVDTSEEALADAASHLGSQTAPPVTVVGDLVESLPEGPFDVVASGLTVHRLADEDKKALFEKVREVLVPDGVFVLVEEVSGPTLALDDLYHRAWLDDVRATGTNEELVEAALGAMVYSHPATVAEQLEWLKGAGFRDVDCFSKRYGFALMGGWKEPAQN
jgi:tRNA (cmo5U34)-methyltransferase